METNVSKNAVIQATPNAMGKEIQHVPLQILDELMSFTLHCTSAQM